MASETKKCLPMEKSVIITNNPGTSFWNLVRKICWGKTKQEMHIHGPGMLACNFEPNMRKSKTDRLLWVPGNPNLYSKF